MSRKTTAILLDPFENAILVEYEVTTEDDDGAVSFKIRPGSEDHLFRSWKLSWKL